MNFRDHDFVNVSSDDFQIDRSTKEGHSVELDAEYEKPDKYLNVNWKRPMSSSRLMDAYNEYNSVMFLIVGDLFISVASLFILNIATSLYARKQVQPTDDNEAEKTQVASSPPTLSTGRDLTVNFEKLTKQNEFNNGENENDVTKDDDDSIWLISGDNIDEDLNDTYNIVTDETNKYELTNLEEETKNSPQLADTRKKDEKANKKQLKTKKKTTKSTNTITTIEPEEIEIEENIDSTNPLKSQIHAYNTIKKQESQVSITFLNDREENKKSDDINSYKNKDNSSVNTVLRKLFNLLGSYMVDTSKNTAPREMIGVFKDNIGEIPVSAINDSKSTDLNTHYPEKTIKPGDENNKETDATSYAQLQTITTIEKMPAPPSGSKFRQTTVIQNDSILPRNLLTIINSGNIEDMQAIVPLGGHNLIFNDRTINPGIHIVTANVTSEEYMESVADMISTLSFQKKADIKILGKKAKKRLVQTLIKSIEEGMILIINSGSINGLSLRLPGTDTPTPTESTTNKPDIEATTEKMEVKITSETPDDKMTTENLNLETTEKREIITEITTTNLDSEYRTNKNSNTDAITSPSTEIITQYPETEVTTSNTNTETTANTINTEITGTEPNSERAITDQNPKGGLTSNNRNIGKNATYRWTYKSSENNNARKNINNEITTEHLNCNDTSKNCHVSDNTTNSESSSPNCNCAITSGHPESEISTEHFNCENISKESKVEITNLAFWLCPSWVNTEESSPDIEITRGYPKSDNGSENPNYEHAMAQKSFVNTSESSKEGIYTTFLNNNCSKLDVDESADAKSVIENSGCVNRDHPIDRSPTKVASENRQNNTELEIISNVPHSESNIRNENDEIVAKQPGSDRLEIKITEQRLDHKIYGPTEVIDTKNSDHFSKSSGEILNKKTFWHINYILPYRRNLDNRKYISHNANIKSGISNENSISNMAISNTATTNKNDDIRNSNRENNSIENTETGNIGTNTLGHRVKRGMSSYFPMLGLLKRVNEGKKIKDLVSYFQRLLDFAENSNEENANQLFKREFYGEEEELVPLNTKF